MKSLKQKRFEVRLRRMVFTNWRFVTTFGFSFAVSIGFFLSWMQNISNSRILQERINLLEKRIESAEHNSQTAIEFSEVSENAWQKLVIQSNTIRENELKSILEQSLNEMRELKLRNKQNDSNNESTK